VRSVGNVTVRGSAMIQKREGICVYSDFTSLQDVYNIVS
jgi:hypothetical protein